MMRLLLPITLAALFSMGCDQPSESETREEVVAAQTTGSAPPPAQVGGSTTPTNPSIEPNQATPTPVEQDPAEQVADESEQAVIPGSLRVVVLAPETLLGSEQRILDSLYRSLEGTDLNVLRDAASATERQALTTYFDNGEWARPTEWAAHDVVLAIRFVEPAMIGRRQPRAYTRGLRNVAIWSSSESEPVYLHESRLRHTERPVGNLENLGTPSEMNAIITALVEAARSPS